MRRGLRPALHPRTGQTWHAIGHVQADLNTAGQAAGDRQCPPQTPEDQHRITGNGNEVCDGSTGIQCRGQLGQLCVQ